MAHSDFFSVYLASTSSPRTPPGRHLRSSSRLLRLFSAATASRSLLALSSFSSVRRFWGGPLRCSVASPPAAIGPFFLARFQSCLGQPPFPSTLFREVMPHIDHSVRSPVTVWIPPWAPLASQMMFKSPYVQVHSGLRSVGLEKYVTSCTQRYGVIRNSFAALKMSPVLPLVGPPLPRSPPPLTCWPSSLAFCRMSYKRSHFLRLLLLFEMILGCFSVWGD